MLQHQLLKIKDILGNCWIREKSNHSYINWIVIFLFCRGVMKAAADSNQSFLWSCIHHDDLHFLSELHYYSSTCIKILLCPLESNQHRTSDPVWVFIDYIAGFVFKVHSVWRWWLCFCNITNSVAHNWIFIIYKLMPHDGSLTNIFYLWFRLKALMEYFKMGLDCFFAVWFVVGNVWIFGGHSSANEAPNMYR